MVAMADGTLAETRARLAESDARVIGAIVVAEILARASIFEAPAVTVAAQFELSAPGGTLCYPVTLGRGGPALTNGEAVEPQVVIRQELGELLRAVYGPPGRHDATRDVWIMDEPGPESDDPADPWLAALRAATLAAGQLVEACSPDRVGLGALARRFGSDKWGDHFYTPHYERHFAPFRDQRIKLLEIGIGGFESPTAGGESLRMWKHYFRRGLVYGIDIFDKSALDEPRIRTVQGDQSDAALLAQVVRDHGPFDIVIDDGSHVSGHVLASFQALFPALVDGGLYAIEDLQTAYWPGWNGGATDTADPTTTTGFLKSLIDSLHHQDQLPPPNVPPDGLARQIRALHLYRNLAVIEKGANNGGTAPSWVRRHQNDMDLTPRGSMRRSGAG